MTFLLLLAVVLCVSADTQYISIQPLAGSSWSLSRQSQNISFDLTSSVIGTIAPLDYHGTILHPYQSVYENILENDVGVKERNSAKEGEYSSKESVSLVARISPTSFEYEKPTGSDIWTYTYTENWPVILTSDRSTKYSGKGINERSIASNNLDFIGSNLLYNTQLSENRRTIMWLNNLNATILAADYRGIISAELQPNKYLGQLMQIHTTGIADLSYRWTNPHFDDRKQNYPAFLEGNERYYGTYDLAQRIETRSNNTNYDYSQDYDWLQCCPNNLADLSGYESDWQRLIREIFDYKG